MVSFKQDLETVKALICTVLYPDEGAQKALDDHLRPLMNHVLRLPTAEHTLFENYKFYYAWYITGNIDDDEWQVQLMPRFMKKLPNQHKDAVLGAHVLSGLSSEAKERWRKACVLRKYVTFALQRDGGFDKAALRQEWNGVDSTSSTCWSLQD